MVLGGPVVPWARGQGCQGPRGAAGQGPSARACPSQPGRAGWGKVRAGPALGIRHLLGNEDRLMLGWARTGGDGILQPRWGRDRWPWGLEWGPGL